MNTHEQSLLDGLRAQGYKLTRARRAVVHALAAASTPLPVNEVHTHAQQINHDVGLVTVYRTLELLVSLGLVRPVHLVDNCHGYALATPGHTHHVVCRRCRRVVEVAGCDLQAFLTEIEQQTGYRITGHWLELEGLCAGCQEAARADGSDGR